MIKCIYDVETYPNFFCVTFKNVDTKEVNVFTIYKSTNHLSDLVKFLTQDELWLVGYNSYSFDNVVMNYIYKEYEDFYGKPTAYITNKVFTFAHRLIAGADIDVQYKYYMPFRTIDLMKIGGLQKSLKSVAVNLHWHKIQDLPYGFTSFIEDEQVDTIIKYNLNDVDITEKLYEALLGKIKLRWKLSNVYNISLMNDSDSGIANKLLLKMYSEETGLNPREIKELKTEHDLVDLKEIIPDYIQFKTEKLTKFLTKLRSEHVTKETKFKKSIIIGSTKYDILKGGLHSNMPPDIYETTDAHKIIDADVASYYPNILINNNIYPNHLNHSFIDVYKKIVANRLAAKNAGLMDESDGLKITANSTFGKMGNKHHWLYDLKAMYATTIIGQLSLLMLIEDLELNGINVFYANTDGITAKVKKEQEDLFYTICKNWSDNLNYTLEYTIYKKLVISTVNDYVAIADNGKIKQKGDYITNPELTKGFDKPIVAIALNEYFINNIPVRDTVYNCDNIYKFCVTKKVDAKFKIEFHQIIDGEMFKNELSKTNRYYMSTSGGRLLKVQGMSKDTTDFCVDSNVILFNDYFHKPSIKDYHINYPYYIKQIEKILLPLISKNLKLF